LSKIRLCFINGTRISKRKRINWPRIQICCRCRRSGQGAGGGANCVGGRYPAKPAIKGINDSKLLSAKKRLELREKIIENSLCWSAAEVSNYTIDKEGISLSNRLVLKQAVNKLKIKPDFVLIDFFKIPDLGIKSESVTHGDSKIYSIACASILAKVYRDDLMNKQAEKYPEYHFHTNKGYLTKKHLEAITEYGWTSIHRLSFWPVSAML